MKNLTTTAIAVLCLSVNLAQQNAQNIGFSNFSLCQSNLAESSPWSITNSAASISLNQESVAFFINQPFWVKGLNQEAIVLNTSRPNTAFSLLIHHFGFEDYQQYWIKAGGAKKLSRDIHLGISCNYWAFKFSDQGNKTLHAVTADISTLINVNDPLTIGIAFNNIAQARLSDTYQRSVPSSFTTGIRYKVKKNVQVMCALLLANFQSIQANFGVSNQYSKAVTLNLGFGTFPYRASLGVGLSFSKINLNIATEYRQQFGFNPGIELSYQKFKGMSTQPNPAF